MSRGLQFLRARKVLCLLDISKNEKNQVSSLLDTNNFFASKKVRTELKQSVIKVVSVIFDNKNFCLSTRGKLSFYAIWKNTNCNAMQFANSQFAKVKNDKCLTSVNEYKLVGMDVGVKGALAAASALTVVTSVLLGGAGAARAATTNLASLNVGDVVTIGGINYVKMNSANLLLAVSNYVCPNGMTVAGMKVMCVDDSVNNTYVEYGCKNPTGIMQTWDGCGSLAATSGTGYTQGPCLIDARDGKTYEIRKFADGKCWMVTNLAYGGPTAMGADDGCINVGTNYRGATSLSDCDSNGQQCSYTNRFGANTCGNCRASWESGGIKNDTNMFGYLYDWVAAVQDPYAYYDNDNETSPYGMSYTPDGTVQRQGICPSGWHLPTGGSGSEFQALADAGAGNGDFWRGNWSDSVVNGGTYTGGNWRGVYSGYAHGTGGTLGGQNTEGNYWSSAWVDAKQTYYLAIYTSAVGPNHPYGGKSSGAAVRCIKD